MQPDSTANGAGLDEPATVDLSGRCVGNSYILICPVGQGATGTVWRGIERTSGEQVAVKLLHEGLLRQPKLVTRFVQERTILMMVRHEHIVGVRDLFSAGESLGLVMDFVAGGSLRERLRSAGTLAPAEAARLLAQVAAALAEAHTLGVVHRDVKPDNILLQIVDGRADARLTDFGIARVVDAAGLTTPHAIIGTPHYMAPEVISGADAGPAADVYAVGVVLYELLTGHTPYTGEPLAVLRHHLDDVVARPPGVSDPAWAVIESCLDKDPDRRPAGDELAPILRDLARITAREPALPAPLEAPEPPLPSPAVRATPPRRDATPRRRPPNRPRSWVWGRSAAIVALVAGALAVSGVGGYTVWKSSDTAAARTSAGAAPEKGLGAGPSFAAQPAPPGVQTSQNPAYGGSVPGGGGAQPTGTAEVPAPASRGRRAGASIGVSAGPAAVGASAGPGGAQAEATFGPWQCGDELDWDIGHPVLAQPCHAVGGAIRVVGHMQAGPGVQADISLSVRDVATGEVAAGPYTCKAMMFTDFAPEHTCGPVDLKAPRGRRYVVVESWEYTGRFLLPGGRAEGREFTW
ncbi:serine/threonine-protein kinase [Actinoplanes sp. NPDC048967]|uniref:serine/threonine-protein kinase n=2 Tax=unclassified Actinoplanes TaxID=2626549 RepID=UPI0033FBB69F